MGMATSMGDDGGYDDESITPRSVGVGWVGGTRMFGEGCFFGRGLLISSFFFFYPGNCPAVGAGAAPAPPAGQGQLHREGSGEPWHARALSRCESGDQMQRSHVAYLRRVWD